MKKYIEIGALSAIAIWLLTVIIYDMNYHNWFGFRSFAPEIQQRTVDTVHAASFNIDVTSRIPARRVNKKLLKELEVKKSAIEQTANISVQTTDTIYLQPLNDSVIHFSDHWLQAKVNVKDSTLTYRARDSLSIYVERLYKRRFLWWRWGTKGYKAHIINYNPHSTISYADYIRVGE